MNKMNAAITGVYGWLPKDILSNADLETMIHRSNDWIMARSGIEERRILSQPSLATSDMAAAAIQGLLDQKGLDPVEIDLIICATFTPDMLTPATACIVADKINARNCFAFDINAACSGFIYGLVTAAQFIKTQALKKIIVVAADKLSSVIDYTHDNSILFGDGAAAVLLEPNTEGFGIIDSVLKSDGAGKEVLKIKAGGSLFPASAETIQAKEHFLQMDGNAVFKYAVMSMTESVNVMMANNKLQHSDIAWIVPHQANQRIVDAVARKLNFDIKRVASNVRHYGNTSAATIPLCLWELKNQLKKGDNIILTAFGAGYTWGAVYLRWACEACNTSSCN